MKCQRGGCKKEATEECANPNCIGPEVCYKHFDDVGPFSDKTCDRVRCMRWREKGDE